MLSHPHVCDQLLWININGFSCTLAFLLWGLHNITTLPVKNIYDNSFFTRPGSVITRVPEFIDPVWRSRNTFPLLWACSTYWWIFWAIVNPQLDSCKHNNTLCGIFLLYSSLTEQPSIEIKWALQDVSELGYLFLDKSSLHIVAWDLDVKRSQL
jgi:hypothetical protein